MITRKSQELRPVDSGTFAWFLAQAAGRNSDQVSIIENGNGSNYYNKAGVLIAQHVDGKHLIRVKG